MSSKTGSVIVEGLRPLADPCSAVSWLCLQKAPRPLLWGADAAQEAAHHVVVDEEVAAR